MTNMLGDRINVAITFMLAVGGSDSEIDASLLINRQN